MMNIGSPAAAMQWWRLPAHGIGLARMEYLVNNVIQAHPLALLHLDDVEDDGRAAQIEELTAGWPDKAEYFVDHLARGIATIAASQYPEPVVVRLSDFKTNEYAGLIGGTQFEPEEENPMLGWRGASRYYSDDYREAFALECRALRPRAHGDGLHQRHRHGPVLPHARGGRPRPGDHGGVRARARPRRAAGLRDGGDPVEHPAGRRVRRPLRRLLHRLERPDPAHPRHRPRRRPAHAPVRRAQPRGQEDDHDADRGRPRQGPLRRHLRPGPERPPRLRRVPGGAGHRLDLAQPRQRPRRSIERVAEAESRRDG